MFSGELSWEEVLTRKEVVVPLSEYEQRVLDELERDLGTDPKLKKTMARAPRSSARVAIAVVAVIAGLVVMFVGVIAQQPVVGLAGFVFMLGSVVWSFVAPARRERRKGAAAKAASSGKPARKRGFMARIEERFDRRREQGEL